MNIQVCCCSFTSDPELRHDNWECWEHWDLRIIKIQNLRIESQGREPCNIKWLWWNKCIARWSITKWNWLPTLLLLFRLLLIENLFTKYVSSHSYLGISIPKMGLWSKPGLNSIWVLDPWSGLFVTFMMSQIPWSISIDVTSMQTNQCLTSSYQEPMCVHDKLQMIIESFVVTPITFSPTKGCYILVTAISVYVTVQQSLG